MRADVGMPDLLVCVTDATNLKLNLRLVLEARKLGVPMVVALNMSDLAHRRGIRIDRAALERELGMPVVETVGVRREGAQALVAQLDSHVPPQLPRAAEWVAAHAGRGAADAAGGAPHPRGGGARARGRHAPGRRHRRAWCCTRSWGLPILAVLLFLMFQAVFSWAQWPMEAIKSGDAGRWARCCRPRMPEGLLRSLLVDGVIAGVGSVLVFLPQILILFLFILVLEDSGYMPRAAFLMDRVMGRCRPVTAAPSFRCCRASPAPFPASWPRASSATGATGWSPS